MRVFLLNPPHLEGEIYMKEIGRCGRKSVAGEIWPQTGLAYLAAVVIKSGAEAEIFDAMTEVSDISSLISTIKNKKFELIIANTTTPTSDNDYEVFRKIRAEIPEIILAFAGTHVSALPEEALRKSTADFVFINEAEITLMEILGKLKEIAKIEHSAIHSFLKDIKGIAYKSGEEIVVNPQREYIENLDTLPFPARYLLPNDKYKMPFFEGEPFATLIPTRGCPWLCIFCRAGKVWGRRIRTRSVENVITEIESIINDLKIRNIAFMTDSLTLNRKWTISFLNEIIKKDLKFRWVCNSRADAVDIEMLTLMKKAGCRVISYGIESGVQSILDSAKKNIKVEDSEKAIELTRKAGLISMAYFIIGLPGETWDTINKTIDYAIKLNPDYVNFHVATPFPGTELYDIAAKNNWLISSNWKDYEEEGSAVIRTEALTADDLMKAQKIAMKKFYFRPSRIIKELLSIRSFGQFMSHFKAGLKIFGLFKNE